MARLTTASSASGERVYQQSAPQTGEATSGDDVLDAEVVHEESRA